MALALTSLIITVPLGIYEIYSNTVDAPVQPWTSWKDVHYGFSRVDQYPAFLWRAIPALAVPIELSRWTVPAIAFIFFAYFGFAEEARRHYRLAFLALNTRVRRAWAIITGKNDTTLVFSRMLFLCWTDTIVSPASRVSNTKADVLPPYPTSPSGKFLLPKQGNFGSKSGDDMVVRKSETTERSTMSTNE